MPIRLNPTTALALWREALNHEVGIRTAIPTEQQHRALVALYAARKAVGDPSLEAIMICTSPDQDELWFVRKTVEVL